MTKTCPDCGLSLQGRDNESETCSDCLLGLTDEQYKEKPMKPNRKIMMDPINMTEELMFHIFNTEFGGELDSGHRFFELYLQLQLYKEKMLKDEEDAVVAIYNDEVRA